MSADRMNAELLGLDERPSVASVLRRWIVAILLFTLICLAANGIGGLLGTLFERQPVIEQSTYGLALWLAYALIGGPLAVLLWWWLWRGLAGPDRHSIAWGLYLAAMYTTSLVVFSVNALLVLSDLTQGEWRGAECATALVWFVIWLLHRLMLRNRAKAPTRLSTRPVVLGAAYGLGLAAVNAGRALDSLIDMALLAGNPEFGVSAWQAIVHALIWAVGGAALWWWHWFGDGARGFRGGFADLVLIVVGVLAAGAAALGGAIVLLTTALRLLFDSTALTRDLLGDLALSTATLAIGAVVWIYHRRIATERAEHLRTSTGLVESGIGLIAMASGFGVVVNALLATVATPLAGSRTVELLLGGLSALVLGAIVWFLAWQPQRVAERYGDAARRAYLVVVFGASAVVALITLLVIAFRVFEVVLDSSGGALERVRAPLGLLVATALVAGYHFAVWLRDRRAVPASAAPARQGLEQIVLVAGRDADAAASALRDATGATVVLWTRADAAPLPSADALVQAVEALTQTTPTRRVLVTAGDRVDAIPLAD